MAEKLSAYIYKNITEDASLLDSYSSLLKEYAQMLIGNSAPEFCDTHQLLLQYADLQRLFRCG